MAKTKIPLDELAQTAWNVTGERAGEPKPAFVAEWRARRYL
jgi:hypothetical protein